MMRSLITKQFSISLALCLVSFSSVAWGLGNRGGWVASGGFGLTISPTLVLINPQLEYVHKENIYYGPMMQMALGDGGALFTFTGTYRYVIKTKSRVKPSLEGGLGLAVASSLASDSVGVHISLGMGFDYVVEPNLTIGTMVRASFAPPIKNFFLSWPIIVARFAL